MSEAANPDGPAPESGQGFDPHIAQVAGFVEEMRQSGRPVRVWETRGTPDERIEQLPVRVGPGAHSGLILRRDVFAELGSPNAGSCAFPLWTLRPERVADGRITLVGPGLQESEGESLPFGQVVIVAGEKLDREAQSELELKQFVSNQVEGYMIRSAPGRLWSRVGRDVAARGFDFEALGSALIAIFRAEMPDIRAMEVLFVTSAREDVERLEQIQEGAKPIRSEMIKQAWLAKGFDPEACSVSHDCGSCGDKSDCDDIREVVVMRRKAEKQRAAEAGASEVEER